MATATMTLTVDSKWGLAGIRLARWLIPVIGPLRAAHLGAWAANHLFRYRVDGGRWRPLNPRVTVNAFGLIEDVPEGPDTPTDAVPADWVPPDPDTDDGTAVEEEPA